MRSWELSVPQLGVLWRRLELAEPPMVLAHGVRGAAGDDPDQQLRDAEAALTGAGLLDEAGIPDPALGDALDVVAGFTVLVDLRYTEVGSVEVRALVASRGDQVTRLVLDDGAVTLDCPAVDPAAALLGVLPDAAPSPGRRLELPWATVDRGVAAALGRGNSSDAAVSDELALLGVPDREVRRLLELIGGDRTLYGQIGVTTRDAVRGLRRCPDVVQVVDNAAGRSAMWNRDGVLRVAPGTYELFHDLVCALMTSADPVHGARPGWHHQ